MSYYAHMSNEVETFTMTLAGRDVAFRRPLLGQVLILDRFARKSIKEARQSDDDESGRAMLSAIARTLDLIQSLVVSDEDKIFLEEMMLEGKIDWPDVMGALSGGTRGDAVADDETPAPKKRAPRKAPAAKAVATRGRAKR